MRLRLRAAHVPLLATALVLCGLYAAGAVAFDRFATLRVLVNLLGDNGFLGVAAIGATFVILAGGIDLSVGAVVACTGILVARLVEHGGVPPPVAILLALALGTGFGALLGTAIHAFRLPPFLVTLAGMFLARGLGFVIHPQSLGIKHEFYAGFLTRELTLPLGRGIGLPVTATVFLVVLAVAMLVARSTRFGRAVYALGGDESSAVLMGLPVARTRILVYALSGLCSALAGVVATVYTQSGDPAAYVGFELDAIAATVIGGTLLSGGVGSVTGTAMGVLILGLIQTLVSFHGGLNSWWTRIVVGLLLLAFILLQNAVTAAARRRAVS